MSDGKPDPNRYVFSVPKRKDAPTEAIRVHIFEAGHGPINARRDACSVCGRWCGEEFALPSLPPEHREAATILLGETLRKRRSS